MAELSGVGGARPGSAEIAPALEDDLHSDGQQQQVGRDAVGELGDHFDPELPRNEGGAFPSPEAQRLEERLTAIEVPDANVPPALERKIEGDLAAGEKSAANAVEGSTDLDPALAKAIKEAFEATTTEGVPEFEVEPGSGAPSESIVELYKNLPPDVREKMKEAVFSPEGRDAVVEALKGLHIRLPPL